MEIKTCEQYVLSELEKYINLYENLSNELINTHKQYQLLLERHAKLVSVVSNQVNFKKGYIMLDTMYDSKYNEEEHNNYEFMKELFYDDWASKQSTEDKETVD